jgi:hypothetical protein
MTKPKPPAVAPKARTLNVVAESGKSREALIADAATAANVPIAAVIMDFSKPTWGELSLGEVVGALNDHAGKIKGGDLARVEAMLGGQAAALNTMFAELARRGAANMGTYIEPAEIYLKLALRAQSQCRATLETLAAIKNPPVIFAKQANIAHGPQQVNNNSAAIARAEEIEKSPTELLEHDHGQRLDTGAAAAASGSDQAMETVGAIHRPAHGRGQGGRQS